MNELLVVVLKLVFMLSAVAIVVAYIVNVFIMFNNVKDGESFVFINFLPVTNSRIFNNQGEAARKRNLKLYFLVFVWIALFVGSRYLGVIDV